MSDASEELFLVDESEDTHGSDDPVAEAFAHTWLDGEALGLRSRDDDHSRRLPVPGGGLLRQS